MTETTELKVGQQVRAFSNRWTPTGWEPIEQIATVLDPRVKNDPDYAGDVEIKIEGELGRLFVPRWSVEPIEEPAALSVGISPPEEEPDFDCPECPLANPGDCMKVGHCEHRDGPKPTWRCFHCDAVFTDRHDAARHFGRDEGKTPACIIKGAEGGLLRSLRDAENQADEAIAAMHDESTDIAKAYHRATARHTQALQAAEEAGYEKGLADGRALTATTGGERLIAGRTLEGWRQLARRDDCFDQMVPSDLRLILAEIR